MEAYDKYQKYLFKYPELKDGNIFNQKEMIEEMAFRQSDSIKQLQDKHKQVNRYLESIRGYNYSNLKELAVYN